MKRREKPVSGFVLQLDAFRNRMLGRFTFELSFKHAVWLIAIIAVGVAFGFGGLGRVLFDLLIEQARQDPGIAHLLQLLRG
jgi:hypothetical protein